LHYLHYTTLHYFTFHRHLHFQSCNIALHIHTQRHIGSEGTGRHCPSRHGCAVPSNRLIFKFCQIWPQPELRRLQGFRRWKKKRHIRSVTNRTDFRRNGFSICSRTGIYCLSDCPFCSIDLVVRCRFCILLPCHWPWQFSEAAVRKALAEAQAENSDVFNHRTIVIRI
jgi:hypothetical protein